MRFGLEYHGYIYHGILTLVVVVKNKTYMYSACRNLTDVLVYVVAQILSKEGYQSHGKVRIHGIRLICVVTGDQESHWLHGIIYFFISIYQF